VLRLTRNLSPVLQILVDWTDSSFLTLRVSTEWETVKKAIDPRDLEQLAKVYFVCQMFSGDFPFANRMTPKVHTRKA